MFLTVLAYQLIEGNGYETWICSLLYVFVGFFGGLTLQKTWHNTKVVTCMLIQLTNKRIAIRCAGRVKDLLT